MNAGSPNTWAVDRYARLLGPSSGATDGEWKYYDDNSTPLILAVTDYDIFILTQGTIVLESFNLAMNGSTLRGLVRTDSLLVAYRCNTGTRRFRLRFKPQVGRTGLQICEDCVNRLSRFFLIKKYTSTTTTTTTAHATQPLPLASSSSSSSSSATAAATATAAAATASATTSAVLTQAGENETLHVVEPMAQEVTFGQVAKCILTDQTLGLAYQSFTSTATTTTTTTTTKDSHETSSSSETDPSTVQQLVRMCLLDPGFPAFVDCVEKAITSTLTHTHS